MTPSSGPPIRTSFLMCRKLSRHAEEVKLQNIIHFFPFLSQFTSIQTADDSLALKLIRCVTLQVAVRSVSIQQRQEAVGLQVARPLMRVWGENTSENLRNQLKVLLGRKKKRVPDMKDLQCPRSHLSSSRISILSVPICCSKRETPSSSRNQEISTSGSLCLWGNTRRHFVFCWFILLYY